MFALPSGERKCSTKHVWCCLAPRICIDISVDDIKLDCFASQLDKRLAAMKDITQAVERSMQSELVEASSRLPSVIPRSAQPDLLLWLSQNEVKPAGHYCGVVSLCLFVVPSLARMR